MKKTHKYIPMSQTAIFSSVQASAVRPNGCTRTCRTRFTNSFRGFRARSPRHIPCCRPAARKREHCRMHAGAHARRDGAPTCTHPCMRARSEGRAPCLHILRRVLLEPSPRVERLREPGRNTKTRDYRTFAGAHRAQTTCAPAHQQARKQAPQSFAQWLQPFSRTVPPRSSRTRPLAALLKPPRPRPRIGRVIGKS